MHTSYVFCEQCDQPTFWPIWLRYEDDHRAHCWRCAAELDRLFTAEAAIAEALAIVSIHQMHPDVGGAE